MSIENTCCFTGHRPQSFSFRFNEEHPDCVRIKTVLKEQIERLINEKGVMYFISGMALGVDLWAAEMVLELKKSYPKIKLECVIPYENQAASWTEAQRNRYFSILEQCDDESLLQYQYTSDCMFKRNKYMVHQSRYMLAVWNGCPSSTGMTVCNARDRGRKVTVIDASTGKVTVIDSVDPITL